MTFRPVFIIPVLVFFLFVGVSLWGLLAITNGNRDTQSIGFSMQGQTIPSVTLPLLKVTDQDEFSLNKWQGQAYAINVWASWCPPCRAEAPAIERLSDHLPVLGINQRDEQENALDFLNTFGDPYTAIGVDRDGRASIEIGVQALPETLIIGPDGTIILHHRGPIFANEMNGVIRDALITLGITP
jgi:cytochrome c biogenesis protein CcmG/thiol:disulfide interchange protein DsbE